MYGAMFSSGFENYILLEYNALVCVVLVRYLLIKALSCNLITSCVIQFFLCQKRKK